MGVISVNANLNTINVKSVNDKCYDECKAHYNAKFPNALKHDFGERKLIHDVKISNDVSVLKSEINKYTYPSDKTCSSYCPEPAKTTGTSTNTSLLKKDPSPCFTPAPPCFLPFLNIQKKTAPRIPLKPMVPIRVP